VGIWDDLGISPSVVAGFDQAEAVAEEKLQILIEGFRDEGSRVPIPMSAFMFWQTITTAPSPQESLVLTCYILSKAVARLAELPDKEFEVG